MDTVDTTAPQVEPTVGMVRVVGGVRVEDAPPCVATPVPPAWAARGRGDDRLFALVDLTGPASSHLYRELREVVARTYWSAAGSITAGLRHTATAVNRHLFATNLHSAPSDRCEGGLVCAVLHGDDLFVLQAGFGQAWLLHDGYLERFSRREDMLPLGIGPLADVHLVHTFVALGNTLLLASRTLSVHAGDAGLARVLPRGEVQAVLDGLEQVGAGIDFAALVVRWTSPGETPTPREVQQPVPSRRRESPRPTPAPRLTPGAPAKPTPQPARPPRPKPRTRREPAPRQGPSVGERLKKVIRAGGRGVATAGAWLAGGVTTLFRGLLPGSQRTTRRASRSPRPVPKENRAVMMAVAVGIPVVLAIVVALAYVSFGAQARVEGLIRQAEGEIRLAQAAGDNSEDARAHWAAALDFARAATRLRPDDPAAAVLEAQARAAIDLLDGIVRLQPVQLWDFGPSDERRQLVVHGQTIFVIDPAGGWVAKLTLNSTGDGVVEQGEAPILVQTGQQIGDVAVGNLIDGVWASPGGERQTSGLLVLEENEGVIGYDPAWVDTDGAPKLTRSFLGTSPGSPRAVDSFAGRLYVLDTDANQIWRYEPRNDVYPDQPTRYFATPPPRSLAEARDMAIDGNIYVLYEDGEILQFLQGEHQAEFRVRGLPDDSIQAVALAVDRDGGSGAVYVADAGNERVVVLGPDGAFQSQLRPAQPRGDDFDALEALVVEEASGRLYVISAGRLYLARLRAPLLP